jgi:hypothetical protein
VILNFNFSYFTTAAGKNVCGGLVLFVPHQNHVAIFAAKFCMTSNILSLSRPDSESIMAIFPNHTMPESDEAVQRLVEEKLSYFIQPCFWQFKVVRMILEQWDVIEIAATGSGKSLPYMMLYYLLKMVLLCL